jgi:hypothetical protein
MILRPTHCRVIMAAAITGRDSTARYSAMRPHGRVARHGARRTSSGSDGDLSLSDLDCSLQMTMGSKPEKLQTSI